MKTISVLILTLAVAILSIWFARRLPQATAPSAKSGGERKALYYQSAMHPWIKSDKPGRCTICGMELTPVYEGDAGFDAAGGEIVQLTQNMIQVMNVETSEVSERPITKTLRVAGTIDDDDTRHRILSAYIPGRIEKLHVNFVGAEVKEGEPLADFYSPNLLQAEREYRALSGELRTATGLRLRQMGLTERQIEELPAKDPNKLATQLLAPVGGSVVSRNIYEGQYVAEGEKLFEIADFSTMWFLFNAYEQDLPWIKLGQTVEVTTPSVPGRIFEGKIAFINPNLDEETRSTKIRVELPNPVVEGRRLLLHRLYADGVVRLDAQKAVALPRSAVIETGPQAIVYVQQEGGAYARRVIKTGRRGDQYLEALSGVTAGEKVVLNGNLLIDGQAEMNRSFSQNMHEEASAKASILSLNDRQKNALKSFILANDAVSKALAKDDLEAFNAAGKAVMPASDELIAALENHQELKDILTHLGEARHFHGAADLASARKMFHPFANVSAKVLEVLRNSDGTPEFQIFECPMVDNAIPGVPKKGRWVEAAGRKLENPYFGPEMLECGKRIIP